MNYERQKVQVDLGKLSVTEDSIESLKETISHYEELGAEKYFIGAEWDRCGDYDGSYIEFYGYRDETDDEYDSRIKKEERWEKERIEQERKKKEAELAKQYAQKQKIEWGSQIRSYVLHPYSMVKDHRSDFETSNAQGFLEGKIDDCIEAYLRMKAERQA